MPRLYSFTPGRNANSRDRQQAIQNRFPLVIRQGVKNARAGMLPVFLGRHAAAEFFKELLVIGNRVGSTRRSCRFFLGLLCAFGGVFGNLLQITFVKQAIR